MRLLAPPERGFGLAPYRPSSLPSRFVSSSLLIDALLHQLARLVVQLAVEERSSLSHVTDVFQLHLVHELRSQGLAHKVIADMFGLPLRTYHERIKRLDEHKTSRSKTIRDAIVGFVHGESGVTRESLDLRFRLEDERVVRSVIRDLVATGVLERRAGGQGAVYVVAAPDASESKAEQIDALALIALQGFETATIDELAEVLGARSEQISPRLTALAADGRISQVGQGSEARFASLETEIGYGQPSGRDAAIFDHVRAVVSALTAKIGGKSAAQREDEVGGSTYVFDLSETHPLAEETTSLLKQIRARSSDLRKRVLAATKPQGDTHHMRVTLYVGQWVHRD